VSASTSGFGLPSTPPCAILLPVRRCGAIRAGPPPTQDADYARAKAVLGPSLVSRGLILRNDPVEIGAVSKCRKQV
jgi:hypothetical protein